MKYKALVKNKLNVMTLLEGRDEYLRMTSKRASEYFIGMREYFPLLIFIAKATWLDASKGGFNEASS